MRAPVVPPTSARRRVPLAWTLSSAETTIVSALAVLALIGLLSHSGALLVYLAIVIMALPVLSPVVPPPHVTFITATGQPALYALVEEAAAIAGHRGRLMASLGPAGGIKTTTRRIDGLRTTVLTLDELLVRRLAAGDLFTAVAQALTPGHGPIELDESLLREAFADHGEPVSLEPSDDVAATTSNTRWRPGPVRLVLTASLALCAATALMTERGPQLFGVVVPAVVAVCALGVRAVRVGLNRHAASHDATVTFFANSWETLPRWSTPATIARIDVGDDTPAVWQRIMWDPALARHDGPVRAVIRSRLGQLITLPTEGVRLVPVGLPQNRPRGSEPVPLASARPSATEAIIDPSRIVGLGRLLDAAFHVGAGLIGGLLIAVGTDGGDGWIAPLWGATVTFACWAFSSRPHA